MVALPKQAHKCWNSTTAQGRKLSPHNKHTLLPIKWYTLPMRTSCKIDCVWKLGLYHCVPGWLTAMGWSSTLIRPDFTWLNIENNYSNDGNEDLMTFTRRSLECGLLWVRASSNKWAVWRVLGREGSWEAVRSSRRMVISSFGLFSETMAFWLQPLHEPVVVPECNYRACFVRNRHYFSNTRCVTTLLSSWGVKECRDAIPATQWLADMQGVVIVR